MQLSSLSREIFSALAVKRAHFLYGVRKKFISPGSSVSGEAYAPFASRGQEGEEKMATFS